MRVIAEYYLDKAEESPLKIPSFSEMLGVLTRFRCLSVFGVLSIGLYALLYFFSADLVQIAQETHSGNKSLFIVPVAIALIFSLAHGRFTSYFWDAMGIKAKD